MSRYEVKLVLEDVDLEINASDVRELLETELRHLKATKRVDITIVSVRSAQE